MKVLHVSASLDPESGGPTKVVVGLTKPLAKRGIDVSVFAPLQSESGCIREVEGVHVRYFDKNVLSKFWTGYSPLLSKALKQEVHDFDLIHIHELWHHPHYAAYKAAQIAKIPYCITIHGGLEPWCLNHKPLKKKLYSTWIQKKILKTAAALHGFTQNEIKGISNFVGNKNVFQIPNGLNLKEFEVLPNEEEMERKYPALKGKKVFLFLGRIHPIKGLDLLAKTFIHLSKKRDDVYLVIAGPDPQQYKREIVDLLRAGNALNRTIFTGMLKGREKLIVLSRADIFILPSYSEGFSISILEAMACGLPVVITKQCSFPEVEAEGAGRIINADTNELSKILEALLDNEALCKEMGKRGKTLVAKEYTWNQVADKMISEYTKILDRQRMGKVTR